MNHPRHLGRRAACALSLAFLAACQPSDPAGNVTSAPVPPSSTQGSARTSIHGITMKTIDGSPAPLSAYAGKVVLVVNTASECGYTPQYEGLQDLHEKYAARGFAVLAFPSNDFGGQEPGSSEQIATFCKSRYGVGFPLFDKVKTRSAGVRQAGQGAGAAASVIGRSRSWVAPQAGQA